MKNAPKCVFGLLDLVKIREIGTTFTEKGQYLKKCLPEDPVFGTPDKSWKQIFF
jgi:hypothetical protein